MPLLINNLMTVIIIIKWFVESAVVEHFSDIGVSILPVLFDSLSTVR